jgi:hypothetical protein
VSTLQRILISLLALGGCRHSDSSSLQAVDVTRIDPSRAVPLMTGCFTVPLIKARAAQAIPVQNNFDSNNCDFVGANERSGDEATEEFASSSNLDPISGFRRGCFSAFTKPDIAPKYKFILSVSDITNSSSSGANLRARYTLKTIPMTPPTTFKDRAGVTTFTVQAREDFLQGSAAVLTSDLGASVMKFYLEGSGGSGMNSPIIFYSSSDSAKILRYFGHVVANVSCN